MIRNNLFLSEILSMDISKHLLCLLMILFLAVPRAEAQENILPSPPKYRMALIYIFEEDTPEFIFVIDKIGFKSVASLKKFLSNLPVGSTLEWAPGCKRTGREPILSSEEEMNDFKAFCAERNINLILVPSG